MARGVLWWARGRLRAIQAPVTAEMLPMRKLLPATVVKVGDIAGIVRFVLDQPTHEQWRYAIESDQLPYIFADEMRVLAAEPDYPFRAGMTPVPAATGANAIEPDQDAEPMERSPALHVAPA